jgi:hypothetical protein
MDSAWRQNGVTGYDETHGTTEEGVGGKVVAGGDA